MTSVKEASLMRHSPDTGLRRMPHKKIKCAYPSKFSGIVSDSKIGGTMSLQLPKDIPSKTFHNSSATRNFVLRKGVWCIRRSPSARPGSRQVLVQGRDLRRIDQEEVFPLTPRYGK